MPTPIQPHRPQAPRQVVAGRTGPVEPIPHKAGDRLTLTAAAGSRQAIADALDLARGIAFSGANPSLRDARVRGVLADALPLARQTTEALDIARGGAFLITSMVDRKPLVAAAVGRAIDLGASRRDLEHVLKVIAMYVSDEADRNALVDRALARTWPSGGGREVAPIPVLPELPPTR